MADGNIDDEWDTDEEDEEYVPPDGEVSDEDISDQSDDEHENDNEEDPSLANPGHKRKTKSVKGKKRRRLEAKKDASEDEKETKELKPLEVDEKKKMDSLWADFLSDPTVKSITPTKKDASESQAKKPTVETPKEKPQVTPEKPKKVTVTELFHFAGETVEVKKEVDSTSEQTKDAIGISGTSKTTSEVKKPAASGGLGNLLQQIGGKKNKLTVLEKTKLDWNTFKKEEGIEEDLKIHNKGKDGYIDKMEFLQRTDLRQFEIEKRIRSINRTRKS